MTDDPSLAAAAHVVQLALTPIFLLTGIASLLSAFTLRLGRVSDRVDKLADDSHANAAQLTLLRRRSRILDTAVLLVASAGALTCCAAITLFVGSLWGTATGRLLFALFGAALAMTVAGLGTFAVETVLAGRMMRAQSQSAESNNVK